MKTHDWPKALGTRIQQVMRLHAVSAEHRSAVAVGDVIETVEDLGRLPVGAGVVDYREEIALKRCEQRWNYANLSSESCGSESIMGLAPITVIYLPKTEATAQSTTTCWKKIHAPQIRPSKGLSAPTNSTSAIPMTDLDLAKLREIAVAATQWTEQVFITSGFSKTDLDVRHIAAFDPPTVIALIDEAERLRAFFKTVREVHRRWDLRGPRDTQAQMILDNLRMTLAGKSVGGSDD